MVQVVKQILELSSDGYVKFLILEICPGAENKVLFKAKAPIFRAITSTFEPTDRELIAFNDFLVNEISRAKHIIPTFKNHFDGQINLIVPNDLQTTTLGVKELKLYPTVEGKYWINDNLLKGFKTEMLDELKIQLADQTITNFNLVELIVNNRPYKIKNRFKTFETGVSHLDVKYRLTTINKLSSEPLIRTINNLKLKVVYIWSEQDLLSFKLSQTKLSDNEKTMILDWHENFIWVTCDQMVETQTFKIDFGTNQLYAQIDKLLNWNDEKNSLSKNYLTKTLSLTNRQFDQLVVLKLKPWTAENLIVFSDLKRNLVQVYLELLAKLKKELYLQHGIKDVESYRFYHFGSLTEMKDFKSFINQRLVNDPTYGAQNIIYEPKTLIQVKGIYQVDFENLFTLGEWIKNRIEKTTFQREQQLLRQSTLSLSQQPLLQPTTYQSQVAYNNQKYASFNQKLEKN